MCRQCEHELRWAARRGGVLGRTVGGELSRGGREGATVSEEREREWWAGMVPRVIGYESFEMMVLSEDAPRCIMWSMRAGRRTIVCTGRVRGAVHWWAVTNTVPSRASASAPVKRRAFGALFS